MFHIIWKKSCIGSSPEALKLGRMSWKIRLWRTVTSFTEQWRHHKCDGVSNHRVSVIFSTVCSGADQRKYQSSASLAIVRGIHRGPVTRKMFPFDERCCLTRMIFLIIEIRPCHDRLISMMENHKPGNKAFILKQGPDRQYLYGYRCDWCR